MLTGVLVLAGIGGVLALLLEVADRFINVYPDCTIRVNDKKDLPFGFSRIVKPPRSTSDRATIYRFGRSTLNVACDVKNPNANTPPNSQTTHARLADPLPAPLSTSVTLSVAVVILRPLLPINSILTLHL